MFKTVVEENECAVKPMNCPCHVQIFNQRLHSYRDLPLRLSEFGCCHRYEPSGALHGLMRLRQFTQDDAHIFCTKEQIAQEVARFNELLLAVYADFGFTDIKVKLSTRPDKRVGSEELWDSAEQALEDVLKQQKFDYQLQPGEGAFYGPKVEFHMVDSIGRSWQLGTVQLDFAMPERLEAFYVDSTGQKQHAVMIHRAILGSMERFIGILIEHHAGALPLAFAPTQAYVLPLSEKHRDYASNVLSKLKKIGIRSKIDLRNEKIGYKIRDHVLKKIPFLIIIGDQELEQQTFALRDRSGQQWSELSWDALITHFKDGLASLQD
jgi:threonyl-tRNA synthetase